LSALEIVEFDNIIPQLKTHIERATTSSMELIIEFEVTRREKRKKNEADEDGRKKRKLDEEIAVEINGDEGDTEIEKGSDDGESVDEQEDHEEDDEGGEIEGDEQGEGDSLGIDVEEESEEEDFDEALAEDSD
jgi:hypothetical protein